MIIDGQQRLTTVYLMLLAARDVFDKTDAQGLSTADSDRARQLFHDVVNKYAPADSDEAFRVLSTVEDKPVLRALVERAPSLEKSYTASSMVAAHNYFVKTLRALSLDRQRLVEFVIGGLRKLLVFSINFTESDDACSAFSDINGKGQRLTGIDLIKNFLVMEVQRSNKVLGLEGAYSRVWEPLQKHIPPSGIEDFFHTFLYVNYEDVQKGQIYTELVKHYREFLETHTPDDYVAYLHRSASAYAEVVSKGTASLDDYPELKVFIRRLSSQFGISGKTLALSLLLAVRDGRINRKQLTDAVQICQTALIRYFFNDEDHHVAGPVGAFARRLQVARSEDFLSELRKGLGHRLFPNDQEYRQRLTSYSAMPWSNKKSAVILYTLYLVESHLSSEPPPIGEFAVEHIWPQTWHGTEWETVYADKEPPADLVNCLGNLTLISQKLNSQLRNMGPQTKIPALASSSALMNRNYFTEHSPTWRAKDIEKRREWLADFIVETITPSF